MTEMSYIGHLLTQDGLKADPKKIDAIMNMKSPTSLQQLKRFIGMVNYLSKFIPSISKETEPLRQLDKKEIAWHWNSCHEAAFQKIKKLICDNTLLKYFDYK